METIEKKQYTAKDFKSDQLVRWCPGCGDYALLATMQKVMADRCCSGRYCYCFRYWFARRDCLIT